MQKLKRTFRGEETETSYKEVSGPLKTTASVSIIVSRPSSVITRLPTRSVIRVELWVTVTVSEGLSQ